MTKRIEWIDTARGIGIILVVAGHANRGLIAAGVSSAPVWRTADLWLYTFHMPLFMLLAGLNILGSLRKGIDPFVRTKLWTVAYPYVLWSLIQGSVMVVLSGMTNGQTDWASLAKIGWQPVSPFWFLYALFVFMMLVAFVRNSIVLIALALTGLIASAFVSDDTLVHQILYQFSFFLIGVLGADTIKTLRLPWFLVIVFAILWVVFVQFLPVYGKAPYLTPTAVPAALAGIALTLALAQLPRGRMAAALVLVGQASMTIFVMHILATAGTRIFLLKAHAPLPPAAMFIVCTTAGVGGPLIAYLVLQRFGLLPVFGLLRPKQKTDKTMPLAASKHAM
ncbi:acyltransferase family protein [Sphingomonas faeni]|uniref:acyltransferase family protein n=1 Tax=Sphingomonas faeni TaxID=185950 RepID=UPI00277FFA22|nr:acyltransferase [Sphingomonas faeni]MDQ0839726.1 fucose 4-O-acetylase-like acetyltransferase [Sphingomonas faeni]